MADNIAETPEGLQSQAVTITQDVVDSLVSGKNPMSSKTIVANLGFFVIGLGGIAYQAYVGGDITSMAPFLVSMGTACVNTVLRFLTTGPVVSDAMQKVLGTLISLPPPKSS